MSIIAEEEKRAMGGFSKKAEINWERLDKTKFFATGVGLFSGVTAALYPFSVIKTRMQIADVGQAAQSSGPKISSATQPSSTSGAETRGIPSASPRLHQSMISVARNIARSEGIAGFYGGFGTVVTGMIPGRIVYMTVLEVTKSAVLTAGKRMGLSDATAAGLANGMGGMCASLSTQTIIVPMDVISSRLMAQGAQGDAVPKYKGGVDAFRQILRSEGVKGLYRGFGVSVLLYAPSSFIWWSTYGASQRIFWQALEGLSEEAKAALSFRGEDRPRTTTVVAVQAVGGLTAGTVSALLTTPLDTIKTRVQVERKGGAEATIAFAVRRLIREEGARGFYRGFVPRLASTCLWGTCMVSSYEFLKRLAMRSD